MSKEPNKKFKRLFYDIETSPNLVFSWNVGNKISIGYDNIVQERAIICICYKWEGESKVYSLTWTKGDDKKMLQKFVKVLKTANEIIGHNSVRYDTPWVRARCLKHGISLPHDLAEVDTLKLLRKGFRLNSNRLDYVSQYLGVGKKTDTGGFGLWKDIVLNSSKKSLDKMVTYCKNDVAILEKVFKKINPYVPSKTHIGVALGKSNHSCPECGSTTAISNGQRITATGAKRQRMHCANGCGKYYSITIKKGD